MKKAIIISLPCETANLIEIIAKNAGFSVTMISGGSETRRIIRNNYNPDLIIINTPLSDEFGQELAENCYAEISVPIILICSGDIVGEITDKLAYSEITVMSRPISREALSNQINQNNFTNIKESSEVLSRIDDIRIINRAKSVLMKYLKFTEPQAHRYIEKQAMNNRCTRRESAEKIINTYEK